MATHRTTPETPQKPKARHPRLHLSARSTDPKLTGSGSLDCFCLPMCAPEFQSGISSPTRTQNLFSLGS